MPLELEVPLEAPLEREVQPPLVGLVEDASLEPHLLVEPLEQPLEEPLEQPLEHGGAQVVQARD